MRPDKIADNWKQNNLGIPAFCPGRKREEERGGRACGTFIARFVKNKKSRERGPWWMTCKLPLTSPPVRGVSACPELKDLPRVLCMPSKRVN